MKILITGLGQLSAAVLDNVLRLPGSHEILVVARDPEKIKPRMNLALVSASALGHDHPVSCEQLDLRDVDQTATVLTRFKPDLVFHAATLHSIFALRQLPKNLYEQLYAAELGPWLPMHLTLTHRLMLAIRDSGTHPLVVNAAMPDVVNVVLDRAGMAPTVGIGNVALVEPAIRRAVAHLLGASLEETDVSLVMHHFVSHHSAVQGEVGEAPWAMRARVGGVDRTDELDPRAVLALLPTRFNKPGGVAGMMLTAATATAVIQGLSRDVPTDLHTPSPLGLPGGYPVSVNRSGVRLNLPDSIDIASARAVNEQAGVFDGIESIDADGLVTFTESSMAIMRDCLGYWQPTMRIDESTGLARELADRYKKLEESHK